MPFTKIAFGPNRTLCLTLAGFRGRRATATAAGGASLQSAVDATAKAAAPGGALRVYENNFAKQRAREDKAKANARGGAHGGGNGGGGNGGGGGE